MSTGYGRKPWKLFALAVSLRRAEAVCRVGPCLLHLGWHWGILMLPIASTGPWVLGCRGPVEHMWGAGLRYATCSKV